MHKALMLLLCGEVVLWGYLDNKIHDLNMTKNRVEKYHDSIAVVKSTFATISSELNLNLHSFMNLQTA